MLDLNVDVVNLCSLNSKLVTLPALKNHHYFNDHAHHIYPTTYEADLRASAVFPTRGGKMFFATQRGEQALFFFNLYLNVPVSFLRTEIQPN